MTEIEIDSTILGSASFACSDHGGRNMLTPCTYGQEINFFSSLTVINLLTGRTGPAWLPDDKQQGVTVT